MSEIRRLLSDAQDAERRGKKDEAGRLLRIAAAWYRDRQMLRRAGQMLRQARRVEGIEEDEPGEAVFGFDQDAEPASEEMEREGPVLVEQRVPELADPALEAWCSFCCRPKVEVGPLVGGPAGAYVCEACLQAAASLLSASLDSARDEREQSSGDDLSQPSRDSSQSSRAQSRDAWEVKALSFELTSQRRARTRFTRSRSRLTLVIGPEGTGKTSWLTSLGAQPDLRHLEVTRPLTAEEEDELLRWIEPAGRSAFLVVRAPVPPPALVLQGEHGEEPLHDTGSLIDSVPHLSPRVLARVDAVIPFDPPHPEELVSLAQAVAEARGVWLPESTLAQLVSLALRSQRGAHELVTLIARIPPGKYGP